MIEKVAESVMQKYKADNLSNLLSLYFQQAPQSASMPYAVFYLIGANVDEIMGDKDDNITNITIQFSLFSDGGAADLAILTKRLMDCYDWARLTVRGYSLIKMQRTAIGTWGLTDESIWRATIDYEMSIQKQ